MGGPRCADDPPPHWPCPGHRPGRPESQAGGCVLHDYAVEPTVAAGDLLPAAGMFNVTFPAGTTQGAQPAEEAGAYRHPLPPGDAPHARVAAIRLLQPSWACGRRRSPAVVRSGGGSPACQGNPSDRAPRALDGPPGSVAPPYLGWRRAWRFRLAGVLGSKSARTTSAPALPSRRLSTCPRMRLPSARRSSSQSPAPGLAQRSSAPPLPAPLAA